MASRGMFQSTEHDVQLEEGSEELQELTKALFTEAAEWKKLMSTLTVRCNIC